VKSEGKFPEGAPSSTVQEMDSAGEQLSSKVGVSGVKSSQSSQVRSMSARMKEGPVVSTKVTTWNVSALLPHASVRRHVRVSTWLQGSPSTTSDSTSRVTSLPQASSTTKSASSAVSGREVQSDAVKGGSSTKTGGSASRRSTV